MKKRSKRKIKNANLKKVARAHTIFSVALFSLYVALSSFYSPEFLFSDMRSKFSALADNVITITAKVLGPPIKPIVTLTSNCNALNLSTIISWPADENSTTFDIDRDGLPLITNLSNTSFQDTTALPGISYEYIVTAHGQMSPFLAVSDPIVIIHDECKLPKIPPVVQVITIDSNNVINQDVPVTIFSQRPFFTGTSNIPNANIEVSIPSPVTITGQTTANALGFWSWQTPVDLTIGQHEIFVTATNPLNTVDTTQTHAFFFIAQKDSGKNNINKKDSNNTHPSSSPTTPLIPSKPVIQNEFDFSLSLSNNSITENESSFALLFINKLSDQYQNSTANVTLTILNDRGEPLYSISEKKLLTAEGVITQEILLPSYIKAGSYRLKANVTNDKFSSSKETGFEVVASPAINLGGGAVVTYPELLSKLGTISLWTLALLLLWLFLFSREYWLYLHAIKHITEKNLEKLGLISIQRKSR